MSDNTTGLLIILAGLYLLPTLVAVCRGHQSGLAIFALNLLLGWTALGWLAAFIWSLTGVWSSTRVTGQQAAYVSRGHHWPSLERTVEQRQKSSRDFEALRVELRYREFPTPAQDTGRALWWDDGSTRLMVALPDMRVVLSREGNEVFSRKHSTPLEAVDTLSDLRTRFRLDLDAAPAPAAAVGRDANEATATVSSQSEAPGPLRMRPDWTQYVVPAVVFATILLALGALASIIANKAAPPDRSATTIPAAVPASAGSVNAEPKPTATPNQRGDFNLLRSDNGPGTAPSGPGATAAEPVREAASRIPSLATPPGFAQIGPGFDCTKAAQPLARMICANPELSKTDLRFNQAYQALRQQLDPAGRRQLQQEDVEFISSVLRFCGVPETGPVTGSSDCVAAQYDRQRSNWLQRLNVHPAQEEAERPIERHLALQGQLQRLGFLPAEAKIDGVYSSATRAAILAWQEATDRPPTGFIGDADAAVLSQSTPDPNVSSRAAVQPNGSDDPFAKFQVAEVYRGPPVMPDFEGRDRKFKDFRTRIRNGISEGTNFAGRYKIIQFGCGTGCSFVLVADVSTGHVSSFPHGGEYDQALRLEYRVSSSLIRASWVPNLENMDSCLQEDLLLKNGQFVSLGKPSVATCPSGYCDNGVCRR